MRMGPTTLTALLNSLQMGFRTLAIQKRSSEVWGLLGAVKNEFDKFGDRQRFGAAGGVDRQRVEGGERAGQALQALAQHLAPLAEGGGGEAF